MTSKDRETGGMEARAMLWLSLPWIGLLESLEEESPTTGFFLLSDTV
jgi:hypothetical protein